MQRELEAATECGTVDGGDDRLAEGLEPTQHLLHAVGVLGDRGGDLLGLGLLGGHVLEGRRLPKKVFFAEVMTTPVMSSFSASRRSTVAQSSP